VVIHELQRRIVAIHARIRRLDKLIARHGADTPVRVIVPEQVADWPRRESAALIERCDVLCPELQTFAFLPAALATEAISMSGRSDFKSASTDLKAERDTIAETARAAARHLPSLYLQVLLFACILPPAANKARRCRWPVLSPNDAAQPDWNAPARKRASTPLRQNVTLCESQSREKRPLP
jgi:hypothetical protein